VMAAEPAALANTVAGFRRNDRFGPSISEPSPTEIGRQAPARSLWLNPVFRPIATQTPVHNCQA
jgi:hypothetical protein